MSKLPSRLRRLEDLLFIFPDEDNAMLLSELDGFLTGLFLCPEAIPRDEWLPVIWGGGAEPFDDPLDIRWLSDMVTARYEEIARDLGRAKPKPIFDIDERNGDILWEVWIRGFGKAMALRPDSWAGIEGEASEASAGIVTLIQVADDTSDLTSTEINRICDEAPVLIPSYALGLYAGRPHPDASVAAPAARPAKVGRNDPCPCGSGKKAKRCCGAD